MTPFEDLIRLAQTTEGLAELYRDWTNDWLTVEAFAEHYGITEEAASNIIEKGKAAQEEVAMREITPKTLKNGAIEIARIEMANGDIYVAADTNGMAGTEWATWAMDREGNTYWGHYFEDRDECLDDLKARAYGG